MSKTKIVNILGGPGVGKTLVAALVFGNMKLLGEKVEYVQEYAKKLVWLNDIDRLNDQYYVSCRQFSVLTSVVGCVDYIITDGPLLHGIYYNRNNADNMSNVEKTEKHIIGCHNKFDNINIYIERNKKVKYETAGRIQTYNGAVKVDVGLLEIFTEHGIEYKKFRSSEKEIDNIVNYILERSKRNG